LTLRMFILAFTTFISAQSVLMHLVDDSHRVPTSNRYIGLSRISLLLTGFLSFTVDAQLIDLHVKLLRKARKSFSTEKWEKALVKFCHAYGLENSTEIESQGYLKASLATKVKLLKVCTQTTLTLVF
jgi:hypothetical protein